MSELNQIQMQQQKGNYVVFIFYKIPKEHHDEMVQINRETVDLFREHGALRYEVFNLSDDKNLELDGFDNISNLIPVSKDEEVWLEMHVYRDIEHAAEFMGKCEKDKRLQPLYKKFIETIIPGSKIVIGDFSKPRILIQKGNPQ
jgi:uncharacterized protein YbaA (DUF1428 family)